MSYSYPDNAPYSLAAGWNQSDSLQVLAGYTPSGVTRPFNFFIGFGLYNAGQVRQLPLINYISGYASVQWAFSYLDFDQYLWLNTTYCNSGYSGLVTALVTVQDQETPEYWNAKLQLPKEAELRAYRPGWDTPTITLFKYSDAAPPTPP